MPQKRTTPLTALAPKLQPFAAAAGQPAPTYRACYNGILNGTIRAERIKGRWYFDEADLPQIARALGLIPERARKSPARLTQRLTAQS